MLSKALIRISGMVPSILSDPCTVKGLLHFFYWQN
jgi:hypothetical protein